jgi:hypothetical protein
MRCPVCRAEVTQGPQCRRCRADLSLLLELDDQRRRALAEAYRAATAGQWNRALAIAGGVDALRSDGESRRLLAACRLLRRDFAGAWEEYQSPQGR